MLRESTEIFLYLTFLNLGIPSLRLIGHLCHCQKQRKSLN